MKSLQDIQENSEKILRQDNELLATKLAKLIHKTIDKAGEMVEDADTPSDLYTAIKIAEVAGKITGIVTEKSVTNIQINQISGFTFVEVDKERIIQERRAEQLAAGILDVQI